RRQFFLKGVIAITLVVVVVLTTPAGVSAADENDCTNEAKYPAVVAITSDVQQGGLFSAVSKKCIQCGSCELCDFLNIGYQVARMIFGIMGAVAFAFVIYGGVLFVISAGSSEMIDKAKATLRNAAIGLFIVAFAWQIVHVTLIFVGVPTAGNDGMRVLFNFQWDKPPCTASDVGPYKDDQVQSFEKTQQPPDAPPGRP
ncbi:MAG: pilin, partial [Patescibacteria group bacterium]